MGQSTIVAGVLIDENTSISFIEVCKQCHISEDNLHELLEYGLLPHHDEPVHHIHFDGKTLLRIQAACRLQQDLGINLPGVVLVMELLDKLAEVESELSVLQRHVKI